MKATGIVFMLGRAGTNKPDQGSKEVGIYVPADVDDKDNAIQGNDDARYCDEAAPDGQAFPGPEPATQLELGFPVAELVGWHRCWGAHASVCHDTHHPDPLLPAVGSNPCSDIGIRTMAPYWEALAIEHQQAVGDTLG
jgi:hypothetical protein